MSVARPSCKVCIDPQIHLINEKFKQGSGPTIVRRWMVGSRNPSLGGKQAAMPRPHSVLALRKHREECLGMAVLAFGRQPVHYVSREPIEGIETTPPPAPRVPVQTPDDPGERAKMIEELLYSSLADLSAKDLYNLHMKELDLKIAQENRLAKQGAADPVEPVSDHDPGGFDEAMARAGGHRPELRIVKPKRAS